MSEHVTDRQLSAATSQLQRLVMQRAEVVKRTVGFGYRLSLTAPSTFDELQREHRACSFNGLPLRVLLDHNEAGVLDAEVNPAFRFWHDLTHVRLDRDFTRSGEVQVGQEQLRQAEAAGHPRGSLAWRLLFAETIGQTECCYRLGVFPEDQVVFTRDYLDHGLPEAIRLEARRQHLVIVREFLRSRDQEVIGSRHHRRPRRPGLGSPGQPFSNLGDAA